MPCIKKFKILRKLYYAYKIIIQIFSENFNYLYLLILYDKKQNNKNIYMSE